MKVTDVRIVRLEPLRVASALGFGAEPESLAWQKILAWAERNGVLKDTEARRFGFNNPSPSAGSPNYGYEQWVTVGPDAQGDGEVEIKTFGGGLYAVARCNLGHIGEVWRDLVAWRERSRYRPAHHQWLEDRQPAADHGRGRRERRELDLYLPIAD